MGRDDFLDEQFQLTRRFFLQAGVLGMVATQVAVGAEDKEKAPAAPGKHAKPDKAGTSANPTSRLQQTSAMFRAASRCRTGCRTKRNAKSV